APSRGKWITFGSPHAHVRRDSCAGKEATASRGAGSVTSLSQPWSRCQLAGTRMVMRSGTDLVARSPLAAEAASRPTATRSTVKASFRIHPIRAMRGNRSRGRRAVVVRSARCQRRVAGPLPGPLFLNDPEQETEPAAELHLSTIEIDAWGTTDT